MFDLLKLPSEIRNIIYTHSVTSPCPLRPYHLASKKVVRQWNGVDGINTALFRINHQVRDEALAIFHANNTGIVCDTTHQYYSMLAMDWLPKKAVRENLAQLMYIKDQTYTEIAKNMECIEIRLDQVSDPT